MNKCCETRKSLLKTTLYFVSWYTYVVYSCAFLLHSFLNTGGGPLGYFDWGILGQIAANGIESAAMFGATAAAMSYCMERGYISRFPG